MDELLVAFYVVIFLGSGGLNKLLGSSSKVILSLIMSSWAIIQGHKQWTCELVKITWVRPYRVHNIFFEVLRQIMNPY